jgi:hypothetical protein
MTIAAGFVYRDGILMCADTLMSGGAISHHQSKMVGYRFSDGAALFAFAGHSEMADAAIQQCEQALGKAQPRPRKLDQIAEAVRRVLAREYKEHVIENGYQNTECDYSIIAAIYSQSDGLGLYCTSRTQFKRSRRGFECIGVGETVGNLAIHRFPLWVRSPVTASLKMTANMAAFTLAEAKRKVQGYCGGESVMMTLRSDGLGKAVTDEDCMEGLVDKYSEMLERETAELLPAFLDVQHEEAFRQYLHHLPIKVQEIRDLYRKETERTATRWIGQKEVLEVLLALNPPEYLDSRRAKGSERSNPQPPKGAPQLPPPSPESPEGSDES